MARKLADKKKTEFWKEVSENNKYRTPLPDSINKANGQDEIVEL